MVETSSQIRNRMAREKAEEAARPKPPTPPVSEAFIWNGRLDGILGLVRMLQHKCGFPERDYQVKFSAVTGSLRLSNYENRRPAEPGEYFWMRGTEICTGDLDDYEKMKAAQED